MERELETHRAWNTIVAGAALGAVAMYVLDPDKGRRRRALARDKTRSFIAGTGDAVRVVKRDAASRIKGLRARARRLFRRRTTDDLVLIERVRARMGRLVSHPHAIQVGAHEGRVTLSGPILTREVPLLLRAVRAVWGVSDVEDRLVAHDRPEGIPSLQGGSMRPMAGAFMHEHWPPAFRTAALLGGALMAMYGMRQRTLAGCALTAVGLVLAARGLTDAPIKALAGYAGRSNEIDRSDAIDAAGLTGVALPQSTSTSALH